MTRAVVLRARRAGAVAAAVIAMTLGAACGGSESRPTVESATTAPGVATTPSAQAFQDCLAQNGLTGSGFGGGVGGNTNNGSGPAGSRGGSRPAGANPQGSRPTGSAVDQATRDAAVAACESLRPRDQARGPGGANAQTFAAYLSCLQDNGVTVSTQPPGSRGTAADGSRPTAGAAPGSRPGGQDGQGAGQSGGPGGALAGVDRNSPAFLAANEKCQVLLPQQQSPTTTTSR